MTSAWRWVLAGVFILGTADAATNPDTISTGAGPVEITPIQHASFTLAAGGKLIYVDPSPAKLFSGKPKADLIIITDIHQDHGPGRGKGAVETRNKTHCACRGSKDMGKGRSIE